MEWKDIPGYEGLYRISKSGEALNAKTGCILHGNVNSHGYRVISLTKHGKKKDVKLHRLLALAFIENPNDFDCINHKDGDKLNNSLENLEWCSKGYNNFHARTVLNVSTDAKPVIQSTMDGKFVACWANIATAAKTIGVSAPCITDCCDGRARQAAGYVWSFAGEDSNDFVKGWKKQGTLRKISELEKEIAQLRTTI